MGVWTGVMCLRLIFLTNVSARNNVCVQLELAGWYEWLTIKILLHKPNLKFKSCLVFQKSVGYA